MKVTLPYDSEWKALAWAKKHCPSYITNDYAHGKLVSVSGGWAREYEIDYFFGDEKDVVAFMLRWS